MIDIQNKIPVHIGLFGHIDSGKTLIAEGLSEFISTAGIDAHPQSRERGITIDLGFTSFILESYLITLVDGPGHADLIKISASSVEIIDCALLVIDITKGPQVQTGEHLIMIEALNLRDIIVILNKADLFKGDITVEIEKTRKFFESTSFGPNVPIFSVSAKNKTGFEELKLGILEKVKSLNIKRDYDGNVIIPIDHHFSIKGRGAVITGTILTGKLSLGQLLYILPIESSGRVKSIQIFHQDVKSAKAGDRVGINVKGIDIKTVYRGCYATDNKEAFDFTSILDISIHLNRIFKHKTYFGTQVHVTIGMYTCVGYIFPYYILNEKKVQKEVIDVDKNFNAILWLNEKVLVNKKREKLLISRLDLPPNSLRILGAAEVKDIIKETPILFKFKSKKGYITNSQHSQGIICSGLAYSLEGAKKLVGRSLESPFSRIISPFGTKGAVIVGIQDKNSSIRNGDVVVLKELRKFKLNPKKYLKGQN
jgi:selenocysteine-specific elongation factor